MATARRVLPRFEFRCAIAAADPQGAPRAMCARTSHDGLTALGQAGIAVDHLDALRERAPMRRHPGLRLCGRGAHVVIP